MKKSEIAPAKKSREPDWRLSVRFSPRTVQSLLEGEVEAFSSSTLRDTTG